MKQNNNIKHYWGGVEVSIERLWQLFTRYVKQTKLKYKYAKIIKFRKDMNVVEWFSLINFAHSDNYLRHNIIDTFIENYANDDLNWYISVFENLLGEEAYAEFIHQISKAHGNAIAWLKSSFLIAPEHAISSAFAWHRSKYGQSFWSHKSCEWIRLVTTHKNNNR